MSRLLRYVSLVSCVLFLLLGSSIVPASATGGTRISGDASIDGPVRDYQVASTGQFAVYSTLEPSYIPHLFSVSLNGGAPVSLTAPLPPESDIFYFPYQISADGNRVVYLAHQESPTEYSIYSIPIAGGTPTRLNITGVNVVMYAISPDSRWVIFASLDPVTKFHLWRAALTGDTGEAVEITPPGTQPQMIHAIYTSPDSLHFLFLGDMQPLGGWGIYSFPITGDGSEYVRLSMPVTNFWVMDYQVTPDGKNLIYRYVDETTDPVTSRLYSVPIAGPANFYYDLSGTIINGGGVYPYFLVSPDNRYVVFAAEKEVVDKTELYSFFLASPDPNMTTAVKLNVSIPDDRDVNVSTFKISPNSQRVAYSAYQNNQHDLFSVPIDGPSTDNVKINQPINPSFPFSWNDSIIFTPDSSRIVFTSMQDEPDIIDLFSVPAAGPASSAIKLNPAQVKQSSGYAMVMNPVVSPNGQRVFYTANLVIDRTDLVVSPALGPSSLSRNISAVSSTNNAVARFTLVPGGSKVVFSGPVVSSTNELFLADILAATYMPLVNR